MRLLKMTYKKVRWAFNFAKWNPSDSDISLATRCIQKEEKDRLSKFVFKKDFKSSLIGRLMMRKFARDVTGVPYDKISFARDDKGKPVLNDRDLAFNVSHQGDFVVFAGDVNANLIGVDVIKLEYSGGKSLSEFFRIMSRQFSANEWETIRRCSGDQNQIAMFCRHWCLKESYVKAIGVGITINLQDVSFKINTTNLSKRELVCDSQLFVNNVEQNWVFEEMLIDDDHCVAVAYDKSFANDNKCIFREITFEELMLNSVALLEKDDEYANKYFAKLNTA